MNIQDVRRDFPILERKIRGKPLVYLDNAATSQKPRSVIATLVGYYECHNANIHRGIHTLAEEATEAYERARRKVARFIDAPSPEGVIFVRNTTEAINLIANTWGRRHLGPKDEILLTEMEHHSNLVPWQIIAGATGARLRFIPIADDGTLELQNLQNLLTTRTRMLALAQASNVLGTINPVAELARQAHEIGALVLVDGAQSVPHQPVSVRQLDCDFLAFSGHKMLGPTGIGVLWGRPELLAELDPFLGGGSMIRSVEYEESTWGGLPERFEAGTPDIAGAIGLGAAIDYLQQIGMDAVRQHELELTTYALQELRALDDMTVYGPLDPALRGGVVAFNYSGIHPHDLGSLLDREAVAIRGGHHCCQPLHRKLRVAASSRASFYVYNTRQDVDALISALQKAREVFSDVTFR